MRRRFLFAAMVTALLGGCAGDMMLLEASMAGGAPVGPQARQEVAAATTLREDRHLGASLVLGPRLKAQNCESIPCSMVDYYLAAGREGGAWLAVISERTAWAFLSEAYMDGRRYSVRVVDRVVGSCRYGCRLTEMVTITIADDELVRMAEGDGIDMKIVGRRGSELVRVPSSYVAGFLEAWAAYRAQGAI